MKTKSKSKTPVIYSSTHGVRFRRQTDSGDVYYPGVAKGPRRWWFLHKGSKAYFQEVDEKTVCLLLKEAGYSDKRGPNETISALEDYLLAIRLLDVEHVLDVYPPHNAGCWETDDGEMVLVLKSPAKSK
jgi:hypothetical protein